MDCSPVHVPVTEEDFLAVLFVIGAVSQTHRAGSRVVLTPVTPVIVLFGTEVPGLISAATA